MKRKNAVKSLQPIKVIPKKLVKVKQKKMEVCKLPEEQIEKTINGSESSHNSNSSINHEKTNENHSKSKSVDIKGISFIKTVKDFCKEKEPIIQKKFDLANNLSKNLRQNILRETFNRNFYKEPMLKDTVFRSENEIENYRDIVNESKTLYHEKGYFEYFPNTNSVVGKFNKYDKKSDDFVRDLIDRMILKKNSFLSKNAITEKLEIELTADCLFRPNLKNLKKIKKIKEEKHSKYQKDELRVFNKVDEILYKTRTRFNKTVQTINKINNELEN